MFLFRRKDISKKADAVLLEEYRQSGDKEVVGELFKRYAHLVLGSCAYYLDDKEAAKDAVMQIFDKLMVELKSKEIENFKGWLSFVVRNHCISELRKKKTASRKHEAFYEFEYEMPDEDEERRLNRVKDEEMLAHMSEALNELKPAQKKCIELFYLSGRSYNEICSETGYTPNEVKSFIQNGKRSLKILIEAKLSRSKNLNPAA